MSRLLSALLLLAGFSSAAVKKENLANKEAVERRLRSQFPLTQFDPLRGPGQVGAIVQILKPGLEAWAANSIVPVYSYRGGFFRRTAASSMINQPLLPMPPGTRGYITKIEARENHILFDVVLSEPLNGAWFKSAVHVEFGKGFLDAPDFTRIQLTVGEAFGVERNQPPESAPSPRPPPPRPQYRPEPITEPPPPPPPPPPGTSPTIEIEPGMDAAQVRGALGEPNRVIKLGTKEIFVYPGRKVTLINGKVSSIE